MPVQLAFVLTDNAARIGPDQRVLIRRHCMLDKNKNKNKNKDKDKYKDISKDKKPASRIVSGRKFKGKTPGSNNAPPEQGTETDTGLTSDKGNTLALIPANRSRLPPRSRLPDPNPAPSPEMWQLKHCSDAAAAACSFPLQYCDSNAIKDALGSFRVMGFEIERPTDILPHMRLNLEDPMCHHAIMTLSSSAQDLVRKQALSNRTRFHMQAVLAQLNQRLSQPDAYQQDPLLYVICILASISILFKQYESARAHAVGMGQILRLRGAPDNFESDPRLPLLLERINFAGVLLASNWVSICAINARCAPPDFPPETDSWFRESGMLRLDHILGPELGPVFYVHQCASVFVNKNSHDGRFMQHHLTKNTLGYGPSALFELQGRVADPIAETIRLATLATSAVTYRLPSDLEHSRLKTVSGPLLQAYKRVGSGMHRLPESLQLWLFVIMLMSAHTAGDGARADLCYEDIAQRLADRGMTWAQIREHLKQILWAEAYHDPIGREAFDLWVVGSQP